MTTTAKRTLGSLTHADFGKTVKVEGYPEGTLRAVQHVMAYGDMPEPWTRLTIRTYGGNEGTCGLPPGTPVVVSSVAPWFSAAADSADLPAAEPAGSEGDR